MKIEIISSTQVRFEFMAQDLAERNINIQDIITPTANKTQGLFQEITNILQDEYNFATIGTPLVFEATMTHDTLSVLVTKMADNHHNGETDESHSGVNNLDAKKAHFHSVLEDIMSRLHRDSNGTLELVSANMYDGQTGTNIPFNKQAFEQSKARQGQKQPQKLMPDSGCTVFTFENYDTLAEAAFHVPDSYQGFSHVYKLNGKLHLVLENIDKECYHTKGFDVLLNEFGQKQPTCLITYNQMLEHGEVIIAENAVGKLKAYHLAGLL